MHISEFIAKGSVFLIAFLSGGALGGLEGRKAKRAVVRHK